MHCLFPVLSIELGTMLSCNRATCKQVNLEQYTSKSQESHIPTKNGHLPSASTRIKSLATAVADLQHSLKISEWRSGVRHSVLWGTLAKIGFQSVRYFGEKVSCAQFLASSQK